MDEGVEWLELLSQVSVILGTPGNSIYCHIIIRYLWGSYSKHMMESFPQSGSVILLSPTSVDEVTVAQKS